MSGDLLDKCYVYFDVWVPTIADYCTSGTSLATCIKNFGNQGSDVSSIYIHNSTLANGANDNSYRYAGASDQVNNFICFGSTTSPCPENNLYRIIGVIGDKVKLIKYDYANSNLLGTDGDYFGETTPGYYKGNLSTINTYYWNYKEINIWSTSAFNKTNLNTNYLNNIGTEWANKIATTTWKVGGNTYEKITKVTPSVAYQNEVVNPTPGSTSTTGETEYSAKIGLMYVSDYGFAASPSAWTTTLYYYDGSDTNRTVIRTINWMHTGVWEWTISRNADNPCYVFSVHEDGDVDNSYVGGSVTVGDGIVVRPSFSLESSITYNLGTGTINDPILIN